MTKAGLKNANRMIGAQKSRAVYLLILLLDQRATVYEDMGRAEEALADKVHLEQLKQLVISKTK